MGAFIHKYTMKLLSLLLDWDISIIKETHSCESGKSSRLGIGRKHQAVYLVSQITTSIGDILLSMFSSQWRFFSPSTSFSSQLSKTAQHIINIVIQNQTTIYGYTLHLDAEKLATIGLYVNSGQASLQISKLTKACVTTVRGCGS